MLETRNHFKLISYWTRLRIEGFKSKWYYSANRIRVSLLTVTSEDSIAVIDIYHPI